MRSPSLVQPVTTTDDDFDDEEKNLLRSKRSGSKQNNETPPQNTSFWNGVFKNPLSKLPLLYFIIGILAVPALAVFHFMDADTTYLMCGGYIILNLFAIKHFRTLIDLKQNVDNFGNLNKKFSSESHKISKEVNKLSKANHTLRDTVNRVKRANAKNRENLKQFSGLQETMKQLNVKTTDELKSIQERAKRIGNNWESNLIEQERDMLHTVFDRYEAASGKAGMTIKEFEEFSKELPEAYQARFARLGTFEKISHDGIHLNFSDFDAALDLFAEMEALDCDIDFTIEKTAADGNADVQSLQKQDGQKLSVLQVEEIKEEEVESDRPLLKQWKTKKKTYNDNIKRKIVINKRVFRSKTAREFASGLGFQAIESDVGTDDEGGDYKDVEDGNVDGNKLQEQPPILSDEESLVEPVPSDWHMNRESTQISRDFTFSFLEESQNTEKVDTKRRSKGKSKKKRRK